MAVAHTKGIRTKPEKVGTMVVIMNASAKMDKLENTDASTGIFCNI